VKRLSDPRLEELRQRKKSAEHLRVIQLAQEILADPVGLADREAFEVARLGASAAMTMNRVFQASQFTEQEIFWAEASGNADLMATSMFHHASALMFKGDAREARARFEAYLIMDTPPREALNPYRWASHFNLGVILEQQRDYRGAVSAFLVARDVAQASRLPTQVVQSLLEAAWADIMDKRGEAAGFRLQEATEILDEHPNEILQATALCHRAAYHWKMGERAEAMRLAQEIMTPDRPGVNAHHRCEASWIAGECALELGLLSEAQMFVAVALDYAVKANWPYLMNQVGDLRRRIVEDGGAIA
jgi:tetratricopeptide (TPR) repeat protein